MVPNSAQNVSLAVDAVGPIRRACAEINLPRGHLRIPDAASLWKPASYLWHVPYVSMGVKVHLGVGVHVCVRLCT